MYEVKISTTTFWNQRQAPYKTNYKSSYRMTVWQTRPANQHCKIMNQQVTIT